MSSIAIIPARGGSKRIPRKNIKNFMGKPMLAYAIEAAQKSNIFDEVMVSTDDNEIAEIAKQYGASIPFMRSAVNSSDMATTADVLFEVLDSYKAKGQEFESLCCIYPCVPFLTANILNDAYTHFKGNKSLMPVCKFPVPVEWALKIGDQFLEANDVDALNIRSQDLVDKYFDAGMFYFVTPSALREAKSCYTPYTIPYVIDNLYCQDIDNIEDWKMAEMKYRIIHES